MLKHYSVHVPVFILIQSLTMHGVLAVGEELGQSPERVFLIQVHEQNGSNLTHSLAVAHLLGEHRGKQVQLKRMGNGNEWDYL